MIRNYFKTPTAFFFFADFDEDDTVRAYAAARDLGGSVTLYAPTVWRGPWDACQVVGHRRWQDIVLDTVAAEGPELTLLMRELKSLPSTTFVAEA